MNGKDFMEAMSYVDEKYIAQAEELPRRHAHWKPLVAAAACLVVVLTALWQLWPEQSTQMEMAQGRQEAAMAEKTMSAARSGELSQTDTAVSGAAAMTALAPVRMTVRVVEQQEEGLLCQVVDPGSSGFQPGQQVTVLLPESVRNQPAAMSEDSSEEAWLFTVTFFPGQAEETVSALEWEGAGK